MKAGRALFAVFALGMTASAFAIPSAPDEAGIIRNPPHLTTQEQGGRVEDYFARYDTNQDGVVSLGEAQRDPELLRVFARADADGNGVLSPAEFQAAAVLAVNERRAARGG